MLTNNAKRIFIILIFLIIISFFAHQFKVFVLPPEVIIYDFEDKNFIIVETDKYFFNGIAINSKKFYINGKELNLDIDYKFTETLYLFQYQNTFFIKSISKTGKIFEKKIIIYKK